MTHPTSKERRLLRRLLEAWNSIPEDEQVPDALNDGIFEDVRALLCGNSPSSVETTEQPARDAGHCSFPDCEQHWRMLLQRCVEGWQKGNDIAGPMLIAAKELGFTQETNTDTSAIAFTCALLKPTLERS